MGVFLPHDALRRGLQHAVGIDSGFDQLVVGESIGGGIDSIILIIVAIRRLKEFIDQLRLQMWLTCINVFPVTLANPRRGDFGKVERGFDDPIMEIEGLVESCLGLQAELISNAA